MRASTTRMPAGRAAAFGAPAVTARPGSTSLEKARGRSRYTFRFVPIRWRIERDRTREDARHASPAPGVFVFNMSCACTPAGPSIALTGLHCNIQRWNRLSAALLSRTSKPAHPRRIWPMFLAIARLALIALACCAALPAHAQILQRKELSYPLALTIAQAALEDCKGRGYATSVVVVDRGGNTVVALRGDDASVHTMENARRKAYTAMTFKMTTEEFIKDMATRPVRREQTTLPNVIAIGGGVPLKVGNDVVGGVGLSGSPGVDEQCVMAGINKVKNQLQ